MSTVRCEPELERPEGFRARIGSTVRNNVPWECDGPSLLENAQRFLKHLPLRTFDARAPFLAPDGAHTPFLAPDGAHTPFLTPDGGDNVEDVFSGDAKAAVLLGPHGSRPEEGDPDPDVPLAGGHLRDGVEDRRRHHPGVEPLPGAVGEDIADLGPRVGQEGDLVGMEDRPDARVGLRVEVQAKIARDREDHGTPDVPPFIEPEELVEEDVVGAGRDEVVCVVEADEEACILLPEPGGDRLPGVVEVPGGGGVAEEVLCDAPVNYPPLPQGASCFIPLPSGSESTGSSARSAPASAKFRTLIAAFRSRS